MTKSAYLALLCGVLAWPVGASAYDGTDAEQQACTGDVFSLCSAFIPNEDPILACLKSKRPELSPACASVLFPPKRVKRRHS